LPIEHDRGAGFWDEEVVDDLDQETEAKLDPEVVSPIKELLDGTTADTTNN
jgi:hypothetical protein